MSDLNSFQFIGRLTRPAELKYIGQNNTPCVNFSIAVNRWSRAKEQEEVYYFDLSYFGTAAANVMKYLEKGKQIFVQGFHKQDRWEKDGEKYSKVSFVVEYLQLLGGSKNGGDGGQSNSGKTAGAAMPPPMSNNLPAAPDTMQDQYDLPEDIPF